MDHQDLRRAHSSGQEAHGVHVCHKCGWPFPNPHPSPRHRRAHKKICGSVEGYKVAGSAQQSVSDDDQHSDDDPKTPTPKVVERSVYEKGSGGIGQGSIQSDDGVFSDAVAEFSDSSSAARTGERFEDVPESVPVVETGIKKDLSAIPFPNNGETTGTYTSEDMKKTNVTDSMIESCLTSVDQEAELTGITATNLDRNVSSLTSSMSDSKTEESNVLGDTDTNGLHPIKYDMVTDASEIIEKTVDTDSMIESCLTSVDQDAEVKGITATNLASEYVRDDEVIPSEKEHSDGFDMHFPQIDVPPEAKSVAPLNTSVDTAEKEVNNTDGIQNINSDKVIESHNGIEEVNASVHVFSVPDDLNVVEDPALMLEDFKDHKGKQLDRFISCVDSWEQFEDEDNNVKGPVFNDNLNVLQSSHLSGGTVMHNFEASLEADDSSSKPMIKSVPDEGEANMSLSEIKMFKNQTSDELGAPADAVMPLTANTHVVEFPEGLESYDKSDESLKVNFAASDAEIDQTTQSVGLDDNKIDGMCNASGESGEGSKKGPGEDNLVANPIGTVQSADCYENQIYPAANLQKDDDVGDYEVVIEKCNKFEDAGYNEKAKTFNLCGDDTNKGAADSASSMETVSCLPELQVNPVTILHEGGDAAIHCENDRTEKCDLIGYDGDLVKAEKCASSCEDLSKICTDKTFAEDPTTTLESVIALSNSQGHPAKKLPDVDGSVDHDEGEVGKFVISGNESMDGSLEENIQVKSELSPESSVILPKTVVEDATDVSRMELVETSSRDLDISSNSNQIAGKVLSDTQQDVIENEIACSDKIKKEVDADVAAGSDHGQNVVSLQKSSDDHGKKEPGFPASDTESSAPSFIASQDSGSQEVPAVASGITSHSVLEEGDDNLVRQHPSPTAIDVDSNSQTDSLEANPAVASGISSQSLLEEGDDNLARQQPTPTTIDVDSNSQTDSLEANWGSFSVLSMHSDAVTDTEVVPCTHSQTSLEENSDLKKSKAECESPYSDKSSDMFEAPSFMTLVEPRCADDNKATGSETLTAVQNPEQPKPASLQTGWFPSMTHVVNDSQGRKKNEEIIAKVTNWSTEKQHTPLKSLLGEASSKGKPLHQKESLAPTPQKDEKPAKVSGAVTTTVNSILTPESPPDQAANKEHAKEWNSPARYPSDTKSEKKKVKGRPSWVQFVCCASVK